MADLLPSVAHIPVPYVMAYDMRPLETLKEKKLLLQEAANNNWLIFFEHDNNIELCSLAQSERGVQAGENLIMKDL